jgi:hypothetical protein
MSAAAVHLQQPTIRQYTRQLRLPTVGGQYLKLAEGAAKQKHGHVAYLEALLYKGRSNNRPQAAA